MTSFPLRCNICPKHPTFSDVSHLLTHVGSKGHLSHYFKVQVRSRQEPSVREQLHKFDTWYDENQIERLLSQRMVLKESKTTNTRTRGGGNLRSKNTTNAARGKQGKPVALSNRVKPESVLDPQLSQPLFFPSEITVREPQLSPLDPAFRNRAPMTRLRSRRASRLDSQSFPDHTAPQRDQKSDSRIDDSSESSLSLDNTPLDTPPRSTYPEPSLDLRASPAAAYRLRPSKEEREDDLKDAIGETDDENQDSMDEKISDATRLKGIYWPGMDLFDSASPTAKRKRNQKKDGSILEQMRTNSAIVEPTELIFWAGGDLKMKRQITGQVESSPFKEETPKFRRQRPQAKKGPLESISTNVPRLKRKAQASKADPFQNKPRTRSQGRLSGLDFGLDGASQSMDQNDISRQLPPFGNEDFDWTTTTSNRDRQRKRDFRVFQDSVAAKQPGALPDHPIPETSNMNYPLLQSTCDFTRDMSIQAHGLPYPNAMREGNSTAISSSFQFGRERSSGQNHNSCNDYNSFFRTTALANKENIEPILGHDGRFNRTMPHIGMERRPQQYFSVQGDEAPRFHTTMPTNMDFAAFHTSNMFHRSLNPLAFSFQQQQRRTPLYPERHRASKEPELPAVGSRHEAREVRDETVFEEDSGDETIDELEFHEDDLFDQEAR